MPCVSLVFYVIVDSLPTVLLFPSPLFLLPPSPTGALVWSALPHHTPSTVLKTGRFLFFRARFFFLGLIAQPRGGRVLFEDMTSLL